MLVAVLALAGCASADATEPTGAVSSALDAGPDAPPPPECNGTNYRHICGAYPATVQSRYGVAIACKDTPFLPTDADGGVALRAGGQSGCVDVGIPELTGKPVARCCP